MDEFVCFNGDILKHEDVKISPFNRGMMYGDGCFETFKSYSGRFLDFNSHYIRLIKAFNYLNIDFAMSQEELLAFISSLIVANKLNEKEALIRFQCWRKGGRGYRTDDTNCDWIISSTLIQNPIFAPLRLVTSNTPVIPTKALDRSTKLSNGLNYIKAAQDAKEHNVDDVLMLTVDGFVSETTISNVFWGKENVIFTPSTECDLLPGVTRNLVIELLKNSEFEIQEGKYSPDDLRSADFVFTTNSISEIRAVAQIDEQHFASSHPELIRIKSMFDALKLEQLS